MRKTDKMIKVMKFFVLCLLQSNQVKRTPQDSINEWNWKLNPKVVVDIFWFISAFLYL